MAVREESIDIDVALGIGSSGEDRERMALERGISRVPVSIITHVRRERPDADIRIGVGRRRSRRSSVLMSLPRRRSGMIPPR